MSVSKLPEPATRNRVSSAKVSQTAKRKYVA